MKLKDNLSSGPDGIPSYVLKRCVYSLSKPLVILFNLSLENQIFPTTWRNSFVTPVFKNGSKEEIGNYRPISKLSAIPKLFEQLLVSHISFYCKNLIIEQQHGFVGGRSTVTNLLLYQNDIFSALEQHSQIDSVYTDFSKAFDKVNHNLLVSKLSAAGFPSWLTNWLNSYLYNRHQLVKIKNFVSNSILVTSGVPQGSHLGPLLFNIFINDIGTIFKSCKFLLFADDLKLYTNISKPTDCNKLQEDLNSLVRWSESNGMLLNPDKCQCITFSRANSMILNDYHIDNKIIKRVTVVKDLGVLFDEKLTFVQHVNSTVSSGSRKLGFVLRNTQKLSILSTKILYMSLIYSCLQYASPVWSPHYQVHIHHLERIQNKFLRCIAYKMGLYRGTYNYSQILEHISINTLETSRNRSDLILLYKLIHGITSCPELLAQISFRFHRIPTRNCELFSIPFHHTNYGYNSSISRILRLGNLVNSNGVCITGVSLCTFKKSLDGVATL